MYCQHCGKIVADGSKFCNGCGAPINAGGQNQQNQYQQNQYQQNQYQQNQYQQNYGQSPYGNQYGNDYSYPSYGSDPDDTPDMMLNILAFFIPLAGIIVYFLQKNDSPVRAKAALKWALTSWAIAAVFAVLYFVFIFSMVY